MGMNIQYFKGVKKGLKKLTTKHLTSLATNIDMKGSYQHRITLFLRLILFLFLTFH